MDLVVLDAPELVCGVPRRFPLAGGATSTCLRSVRVGTHPGTLNVQRNGEGFGARPRAAGAAAALRAHRRALSSTVGPLSSTEYAVIAHIALNAGGFPGEI